MAFSPLPGSRLSSPKWGSPKFCLESPRCWGLPDGLNNNFLDNFFSSEGGAHLASPLPPVAPLKGQPSPLKEAADYLLNCDFPGVPSYPDTTVSGASAALLNQLGVATGPTHSGAPEPPQCPVQPQPEMPGVSEEEEEDGADEEWTRPTRSGARRGKGGRGGRAAASRQAPSARGRSSKAAGVAKQKGAGGPRASGKQEAQLLYRGIWGGSCSMRAQTLPWALSLVALNTHITAATQEAWPDADS